MSKILIVEDNNVLLKALDSKLRREGFQTVTANDGAEVINIINKEKPDLVLLDILLPNKSGMEILEELYKKDIKLTIIIISNSGQFIETERAKRLGVKDFLVKTDFTPQEVLEKVKKYASPSSSKQLSHAKKEINTESDFPESKDKKNSDQNVQKNNNSDKLVMVIEDDNLLRRLLTKGLTVSGFKVESISSGKEALEKLKSMTPSVILLDLVMPGIDGFYVLEQIRKNEKTKKLPVIILSNLGDEESIAKTKALGVEDYLVKANIFLGEVQDKVLEVIKKYSS
jgi:DNA-binding response OmpR family regulator